MIRLGNVTGGSDMQNLILILHSGGIQTIFQQI